MKRRTIFKKVFGAAAAILTIPQVMAERPTRGRPPVLRRLKATDPGAQDVVIVDYHTGEEIKLVTEIAYRGLDELSDIHRLVSVGYVPRERMGDPFVERLVIARGPHKGELLEMHPQCDIEDCRVFEERRVIMLDRKKSEVKVESYYTVGDPDVRWRAAPA